MLDPDIVKGLMQQFNPFGLKTLEGFPITFDNPIQAYSHVINMMFEKCPRGYIETTFILKKLYPNISNTELSLIHNNLESSGIQRVNIVDYQSASGRRFLESFFRALNELCQTKFNEGVFLQAYQMFLAKQEIQKVKLPNSFNLSKE